MESYELDKLIGNLVVWAAGSEPPLAAEGLPPVVQFSLTERDDGAVIVTVTNHATKIRSAPALLPQPLADRRRIFFKLRIQ